MQKHTLNLKLSVLREVGKFVGDWRMAASEKRLALLCENMYSSVYGGRCDVQTHFMQCQGDPENFGDIDCKLFDSPKPRTMALSVLVVIEVLNAFNRWRRNAVYCFVVVAGLCLNECARSLFIY